MAKKKKIELPGNDKGPDAIHRGPRKGCGACAGTGFVRVEGQRSARKPCDACSGYGGFDQLPHEDYHNLVADALVFAQGRMEVVARRVNNLERLYSHGRIDKRTYDAGVRFKEDFERGQLSGLAASKLERVSSSHTGDNQARLLDLAARKRVYRSIRKMGGHRSLLASAAWDLIGMELPMARVLEMRGKSRYILNYEALTEQVIAALKHIADVYKPTSKRLRE